MQIFKIKNGLDINYPFKPERKLIPLPVPETIGIHISDFRGIRPKLLVEEGTSIKGGTPLFNDIKDKELAFISPLPGKIKRIKRDSHYKLKLIEIDINVDLGFLEHQKLSLQDIMTLSKETALKTAKNRGFFSFFKTRPFNKVPDTNSLPKAIFINACNSAPGELEQGFILRDHLKELKTGLAFIKKITSSKIFFCVNTRKDADLYKEILQDTGTYLFTGPHPSGLTGTHIYKLDPLKEEELIWNIKATHLRTIGSSLNQGYFDATRFITVSGSNIKKNAYYQTVYGMPIKTILKHTAYNDKNSNQTINGTVLFGEKKKDKDYLSWNEDNIQTIEIKTSRNLFGWLLPEKKDEEHNNTLKGDLRSIIQTDIYDTVTPLNIYSNFLIKAILDNNLEEAIKLGMLELIPEDLALATYLCPSKIDLCQILEQGLTEAEKEL